MRRALAAVGLAVVVLVSPFRAYAQSPPRIALGPFTGTRAPAAQAVVSDALREHPADIELVPESEYASTAARLGVAGLAGDEDIARVGRELRLDGVVAGDVSHRGRGYLLRLRVVRGRDGQTVGTASWELQSLAELETVRNEVWSQLHRYVVAAATGSPGAPDGVSSVARAGEPASGGSAQPGATTETPGLGWLTASLGAGVAMRYWRISVLGESSPRGYDNGGYAEARGEVMALYRWSHDRAGIGVAIGAAFPMGLSSRAVDPDTGNTIQLSSSALELWGGAAGVYRPPGGGWMRLQIGFATQSFAVDTDALPVAQRLAPASYTGVRGAFDCVLPLWATSRWELGVLLAGDVRVVDVSAEMKMRFGGNPRPTVAVGAGFGFALRLDGWLPGLGLRVAAEMMRYRTSFAGTYTIGPGSDSVDDFVRVYGALSYAIGTGSARR